MKINLKKIRTQLGKTDEEFAKVLELNIATYDNYEENGELPSKHVYKLWKKYKDFPLPDDFFYYTSYTLYINMKYHNLTQTDIAKLFNICNQSTISYIMQENIPMYELKEEFNKFNPFIIPKVYKKKGLEDYKNLVPKRNFAQLRKKQEIRRKKLETNA